jgi:hypothetical protein
MKVCHIIILIALICQPLAAADGVHYSFAPKLNFGFGHTTYTMDNVYIADTTGTIIGKAKSELKFPLDAIYAGIEAEICFETSGYREWFINAAGTGDVLWGIISSFYSRNIIDRWGVMTDGDWITPIGYNDFKWSYTESDVKFSYDMVSFQVGRRIHGWEKAVTYAVIGYRYQKIVQNIINVRGWQYDLRYSPPPLHDIDTTIHALDYEVTYHKPSIGILYDVRFNPQTHFELSAGYMHVFASDIDDHILRNKISEASGTGPGFYSSIEFSLIINPDNPGLKPFINLNADFSILSVSSAQTQKWYGDDPITDNYDDTGDISDNIPHKFSSMQLVLGIQVGLAF